MVDWKESDLCWDGQKMTFFLIQIKKMFNEVVTLFVNLCIFSSIDSVYILGLFVAYVGVPATIFPQNAQH